MMIYCFRDKVIHTQLTKYGGVIEDETPRGKKYKRKGGLVQKVMLAVDLYFIVPNKIGWYGQMVRMQDHFKTELTKWNESVLEYVKEPLSDCSPSESYYTDGLVKAYGNKTKMFLYEISDMEDNVKSFKYHGCYAVGAWRSEKKRPLMRPNIPFDWDLSTLSGLARDITR